MSSAAPAFSAPAAPRRLSIVYAMTSFVIFCWASNIIAGKEALKGIGPLALAQLRVAGAAIIYALWFVLSGRSFSLHLSRRVWILVISAAVTGISLNQITFIGGLAHTTAAHSGLIVALGPIMVLVIAVTVGLEALTPGKFAGMLVASVGVVILTAERAGKGSGSHVSGDLIMLASTAIFAVYTVLMKELADQVEALTLNTVTYVLGSVLMLPFCARDVVRTTWNAIPSIAWWGLGFLIVFGSVISYMVFAYVLTRLAASRVAAFNYLQPVIAGGLGVWMLSERLTWKVLIGGGLILAGLYLTERERGEGKTTRKALAGA